jgi:DNA-binding NarL/FixJ family response regulator
MDAEQSRLAGHSDPDLWARAVRYSRACSRPHQAAYAAWRQTEALLAQHGARTAAASCLREGYALAARIGAQPLQREIEELAGYARIDLTTAPRPEEPAPVAPPLQALTGRERDVLEALAAGLTNRQIAERLYISPRTAAVHVSHVLHKLGVPDRIQAAHLARKLHAS